VSREIQQQLKKKERKKERKRDIVKENVSVLLYHHSNTIPISTLDLT